MTSTAIAIAISIALGGAVGSAATALTISYASNGPGTCPSTASDEATKRFFTPAPPLPTTGYRSYGADY